MKINIFPTESILCPLDVKLVYPCVVSRFGGVQRFPSHRLLRSELDWFDSLSIMMLLCVHANEPPRGSILCLLLILLMQQPASRTAAWLLCSLSRHGKAPLFSFSSPPPSPSEPRTASPPHNMSLKVTKITLWNVGNSRPLLVAQPARKKKRRRAKKKQNNISCSNHTSLVLTISLLALLYVAPSVQFFWRCQYTSSGRCMIRTGQQFSRR